MKQPPTKTLQDSQVDWTAGSTVDPKKLETGFFKFQGTMENRSQERVSQRELGRVNISIRLPGGGDWLPVKLWDFTSISFGIHYVQEAPFVSWTPESVPA